jgi:hypothetical protein
LCFISFIDRLLKEKLASGVAEKLVWTSAQSDKLC